MWYQVVFSGPRRGGIFGQFLRCRSRGWSCEVHQRMRKWWLRNHSRWRERIRAQLNEWINEPMKQWINAFIDLWVSEAVKQWLNEWTNQWTNESMNQSMNQWISESMNQWIDESVNQWSNESMIQWNNQCISESMSQWTNEWRDGFMNECEWMDGRATCLCWATSSLSDLFAKAFLLSATSSLGIHLSGLLLLWAASKLFSLRSCYNAFSSLQVESRIAQE